MGIVNVTPDSFSDGGRFLDPGRAVEHGLELVAAGADVLDVGGESTRPGSQPVPADEQRRRVVPVVRRLAAEAPSVPISVDTTDACGGRRRARGRRHRRQRRHRRAGRPRRCCRSWPRAGAGYVVMHMQGTPATMQVDPRYDDVVAEVGRLPGRAPGRAPPTPGSPTTSWSPTPGSGSARRSPTTWPLLARLGDVAPGGRRPGAGRPVPEGVHRRRRRRPGAPLPVDRGRRPRWPPSCGPSTTGRRWCGCTTSAVGRAVAAVAACLRRRWRASLSIGPMAAPQMKGKWARGIEPRMFSWVIKDRMAACERPGGYARNHRKVRRLEEIIWLREHGFTMIVSLLDSPHNLHAYDEMSMPHTPGAAGPRRERPGQPPARRLRDHRRPRSTTPSRRSSSTSRSSATGSAGVLAGYLLYAGLVETGPIAISVIERLTSRQLGPARPGDRLRHPRREAPPKQLVLRCRHVTTAGLPGGLSCRAR